MKRSELSQKSAVNMSILFITDLIKIQTQLISHLKAADIARRHLKTAAVIAEGVTARGQRLCNLFCHTDGARGCRRLLKIRERNEALEDSEFMEECR